MRNANVDQILWMGLEGRRLMLTTFANVSPALVGLRRHFRTRFIARSGASVRSIKRHKKLAAAALCTLGAYRSECPATREEITDF